MKPDSYYLLKDETDLSFYVFRLKDHSPAYVWQQIAYVRIGEGESWKGNPDLAALLDVPKADTASNSRRKTNADKTRQKILELRLLKPQTLSARLFSPGSSPNAILLYYEAYAAGGEFRQGQFSPQNALQ